MKIFLKKHPRTAVKLVLIASSTFLFSEEGKEFNPIGSEFNHLDPEGLDQMDGNSFEMPISKGEAPNLNDEKLICDTYCVEVAPTCKTENVNCCEDVVNCNQSSCCGKFLFFGDFLYWFARETDLSYALEVKSTFFGPDPNFLIESPSQYEYLGTRWDPGFRVGLGYITEGGLDMTLSWTYFKNKKRNSVSVLAFDTFPGNDIKSLVNPWVDIGLNGGNNLAILYDQITGKYELKLNYADIQFGYKFCVGRCFSIRPYFGGRGAWTETDFHTFANYGPATYLTVADYQQTSRIFFKNHYWGAGILSGFQPVIKSGFFSLYGNFDASLVWGKAKGNKCEKELAEAGDVILIDYDNDSDFSFFKMQPIIDLAVGLRWEIMFGCNCSCRFAVNAGWEQHIWFSHNLRLKSSTGFLSPSTDVIPNWRGFKQYHEVAGDLMIGGIVVGAEIEF